MRPRPLLTLVAHLAGSVLFSSAHYAMFVLFRKIVFALNGLEYMSGQQQHLGRRVSGADP